MLCSNARLYTEVTGVVQHRLMPGRTGISSQQVYTDLYLAELEHNLFWSCCSSCHRCRKALDSLPSMWQLGKRPGIHHTRRGSKHMSLHAAKNADSAFDCFSRALKALQVSTVSCACSAKAATAVGSFSLACDSHLYQSRHASSLATSNSSLMQACDVKALPLALHRLKQPTDLLHYYASLDFC